MSELTLHYLPLITDVRVDDAMLHVTLDDGRELSVPLEWFPRLRDGSPTDRANWRFVGQGEGIHWPELDDDISVIGLISGKRRKQRAA